MGSMYLRGADDLMAYNVLGATDAQITLASAFIDAYLGRPEGLVWMPDATGAAAYMDALSPNYTLTMGTGGAEPGSSVVVQYSGPAAARVGDVVILDRGTAELCEACAITAAGPGTLTLASVRYEHLINTTMDLGLVITEERSLPEDRPICIVSRTNMQRVLSGLGRYSFGRRSAQSLFGFDEFNLVADVGHFGGPPLWTVFDPAQADFNQTTGEVWIPAGLLSAYYNEARLHYVAGFSYAALPYEVKQATANVIQAKGNNDALNGNIQTLTMGSTRITRFSNTLMDDDTKLMLKPFRARRFG